MVVLSVCMSICQTFLSFKKRFQYLDINLSNMTKLILLDSLLQEVTSHAHTCLALLWPKGKNPLVHERNTLLHWLTME